MSLPIILDLILIAVFVISFVLVAKRGFVKSVYKLIAIVGTVILVMIFANPVTELLSGSPIGTAVHDKVYSIVTAQPDLPQEQSQEPQTGTKGEQEQEDQRPELASLPAFLSNPLINQGRAALAENAVPAITNSVLKVIACIGLFLVIRLAVYLVFAALDGFCKLPVLNGANRLLGGVAGLLNALLLVYIVCGLFALNMAKLDEIQAVVDQTYLVKYFYNYNILMELFLGR